MFRVERIPERIDRPTLPRHAPGHRQQLPERLGKVRAAVREFPLSWRKPVLALAVLALRVFGAGFIYDVCWTLFAPFRRRM